MGGQKGVSADYRFTMPTDDQAHSARIHGEALREALHVVQQMAEEIEPSLWDDPGDRAELAGTLAGEVFAQMGRFDADHEQQARQLILAGLLLTTKPVDHRRIKPAVRAAYEDGRGGAVTEQGYSPA